MSLPEPYASWVEQALGGPLPKERTATCDNCVMLPRPQDPHALDTGTFDPRSKCCTYHPDVPNYRIGGLLASTDPAWAHSRRVIEDQIAKGAGVTPISVAPPPQAGMLYQLGAAQGFGRSQSMRCPHYLEEEGGLCGMWPFRNSVCATYFCKHDRGSVGHRMWQRVRDLVNVIEGIIARHCVLTSDLGEAALTALYPPTGTQPAPSALELDGQRDPHVRASLWGQWLGREREFFLQCAERAQALTWEDVQRIGGVQLELQLRLTADAYREHSSDALPPAVRTGPYTLLRTDGDHCVVQGGVEPVRLPRRVLDLMPQLEEGKLEEAVERIAREQGVRVRPGLIRKLLDFELLHPAAEPHVKR